MSVKSAQQLAQAKFLLAYFSVFSVDRPANIPVWPNSAGEIGGYESSLYYSRNI